ncbi:hypothetical protein B0H13DRAFT_2299917 [Mycena leptocephala]|nr:hypothetical protein B0H13DRAFT_2299917 [Mycena leptocephala]
MPLPKDTEDNGKKRPHATLEAPGEEVSEKRQKQGSKKETISGEIESEGRNHLQLSPQLESDEKRPQHYNTTADGMNKALSTAYRYAGQMQDQDLLNSYGFSSSRPVTSTLPITSKKLPPAWKKAMLETDIGPQRIPPPINTDREESLDDDIQIISAPTSPQVPATRQASQSPDFSEEDLPPVSEPVSAAVSDDEGLVPASEPVSSATASETGDDLLEEQMSVQNATEEQLAEAWEDELEENIASTTKGPLRGWEEIRTEVKAELKKNSKIMPLSRVNQLMLISNFAPLGSAVAVERVFSGGRDTIALRRASLQPSTIRTLMVLRTQLRVARKEVLDVLDEADAIGLDSK